MLDTRFHNNLFHDCNNPPDLFVAHHGIETNAMQHNLEISKMDGDSNGYNLVDDTRTKFVYYSMRFHVPNTMMDRSYRFDVNDNRSKNFDSHWHCHRPDDSFDTGRHYFRVADETTKVVVMILDAIVATRFDSIYSSSSVAVARRN